MPVNDPDSLERSQEKRFKWRGITVLALDVRGNEKQLTFIEDVRGLLLLEGGLGQVGPALGQRAEGGVLQRYLPRQQAPRLRQEA